MAEWWADNWAGPWDGNGISIIDAGEAAIAAGRFDPFYSSVKITRGLLEVECDEGDAREELLALPADAIALTIADEKLDAERVDIYAGPAGVTVRARGLSRGRAAKAFRAAVTVLAASTPSPREHHGSQKQQVHRVPHAPSKPATPNAKPARSTHAVDEGHGGIVGWIEDHPATASLIGTGLLFLGGIVALVIR